MARPPEHRIDDMPARDRPSGKGFNRPAMPLAEIETEGAALVRTALADRKKRPEALRNLAALIVDVRRYYTTENGSVDWRGRTWEYREKIHELFEKWGVPADSEDALQASLRYHVGNYLREVLTPEQLKAANLRPAGPRQRLQSSRDELRAILRAAANEDDLDLSPMTALTAAKRLLEHVKADPDFDHTDEIDKVLRSISRTTKALSSNGT